MSPRSYVDIAHEAGEARRVIMNGAPLDQPVSGIYFFENLNRYAVSNGGDTYSLDYDVQDYPPEMEALTAYVPQRRQIRVTLSTQTYRRLEVSEPRALFTAIHEAAHAILHCATLIRLGTIPHDLAQALHRGHPNVPIYMDSEWQADVFASYFSVNTEALQALDRACQLHAHILVERFGVSHSAAEQRIRLSRAGKG